MLEVFLFVLERVSQSKWAWVAEISAVMVLFMSTVAISAAILYSRPVQRFWGDIKSIVVIVTAKAHEAKNSPYDRNIEDNRIMAWFMIGWFYLMMVAILIYSLPFALIFSGMVGPEELPFYKRIVALGMALAMWYFSRLMKVEGDKILYKIRRS